MDYKKESIRMNIKLIFWAKMDFITSLRILRMWTKKLTFGFHIAEIFYPRRVSSSSWSQDCDLGIHVCFALLQLQRVLLGDDSRRKAVRSGKVAAVACGRSAAPTHTQPSTLDSLLCYGNVKSYSDSCFNCGLVISVYEETWRFQ
jgi:hypothetical protein